MPAPFDTTWGFLYFCLGFAALCTWLTANIARSRYGRAELSCVIRLDNRLDDCRIVDETPPGLGFGAAGLQVSGFFRFQPPTENGRPVQGQRVTVGIDFGRPPR